MSNPRPVTGFDVQIRHGSAALNGELVVPSDARAAIVFVPGSGADWKTPRNVYGAAELNAAGFATLLFELLTLPEAAEDARTARFRFVIDLMTARVAKAIEQVARHHQTSGMPIGLYGVGSGAAAALAAAAADPDRVFAIVSRGGRTELAWGQLARVMAPTLFLAGELDPRVVMLNQMAVGTLGAEGRIEVVRGAGHLFEEVGALAVVASMTVRGSKSTSARSRRSPEWQRRARSSRPDKGQLSNRASVPGLRREFLTESSSRWVGASCLPHSCGDKPCAQDCAIG